jgi:hypothetical protein
LVHGVSTEVMSLHFSSQRSLFHCNCINSAYNTDILKHVFMGFISWMKNLA